MDTAIAVRERASHCMNLTFGWVERIRKSRVIKHTMLMCLWVYGRGGEKTVSEHHLDDDTPNFQLSPFKVENHSHID